MVKKKLTEPYVPSRGDICWLTFDPHAGNEQAKRRPAIVVSDRLFNSLGLAVVCPVTSAAPRHKFHVVLPAHLGTTGCVMTEQLKSLDYLARNAEYIERAPVGFVQYVRGIIAQVV